MNILVLMNSILSMLPTGTAGYLVLILALFILVVLLAIKTGNSFVKRNGIKTYWTMCRKTTKKKKRCSASIS